MESSKKHFRKEQQMDCPLAVSIAANLLLLFLYIHAKVKCPKVYGTVVFSDAKNMYIEFDSNEALTDLYSKDEATFRIKRPHK